MAVLIVRITFVFLSYFILRGLNWRELLSNRNFYLAQYLCLLTSIALGHLVGSFFITTIEILRDTFLAIYYN
ncbi:DUF1146 family protein [Hutsoniella sourekii]|uniref:DUF1146 family protein n=1 Tax=Hutsoniella sourekii TaxID=87650 RepID=UPI0005582BEB